MATTGSFDVNLTALGQTTNNAIAIPEAVTLELREQADLIGLGIAIAISLSLIFGAVFLVINFIPALVNKVKSIKGGR